MGNIKKSARGVLLAQKIKTLKEIQERDSTNKDESKILQECISSLEYEIRNKDIILMEISDIAEGIYKVNLNTKTRKQDFVHARQLAHFLAYTYTKVTTTKIGLLIGGVHHATVNHGVQLWQDCIDQNMKFPKVNVVECELLQEAVFALKKKFGGLVMVRSLVERNK